MKNQAQIEQRLQDVRAKQINKDIGLDTTNLNKTVADGLNALSRSIEHKTLQWVLAQSCELDTCAFSPFENLLNGLIRFNERLKGIRPTLHQIEPSEQMLAELEQSKLLLSAIEVAIKGGALKDDEQ